jgi:uncharacterized membrane protein
MHERETTFGPVQMLSFVFDQNRFKGEIIPELERLKEAGIARIIDLVLVRKDRSGAVSTLTASDLEWEEATEFGAYIGTLVGLGADGVEGAERGAMAGAAEMADGHLFDEEDVFRLTEVVDPGSSIALVLLEHLWIKPLLDAVTRANGYELSNDWVSPERLLAFGLAPGDGV